MTDCDCGLRLLVCRSQAASSPSRRSAVGRWDGPAR